MAAKIVEAGLMGQEVQNAADTTTISRTSSKTNVDANLASSNKSALDQNATAAPSEKDALSRHGSNDYDLEKVAPGPGPGVAHNEATLLHGVRLLAVFAAMMLSVFMFALDQSIVSTAIPIFTSEFNAFAEVSWVITAYFLTQVGLILLAGQLLTIIKAKWVLLVALFFFELGSLIAGVAKSMNVLIVGRAIQGIGASGMFSSMMLIIVMITRVEQRPAYLASFGGVFVISSVVGPLLGGVFTEHVSWRWCFYINLPIGGIAAAAVVFLLPATDPPETEMTRNKTILQRLKGLDYIGTLLSMSLIVCLLLALADGGNKYAWSNWRIIFEFVLAGVLVIALAFWELRLNERALLPKAILFNRTLIAASVAVFMTMMVMLGAVYQLPIYYEAVKNHSPTKAGIDIIPAMLSICIAIFISGGGTQATGYYLPWIVAGPIFSGIGFGLLSTIDAQTSSPRLIGYQILAGAGIGFSFQNILLSVQAEFHDRQHLMAQAVGISNFFQLAGAAIGVGIVNTVQSVYLNREIRAKAPEVPFELVRQSVTAIYTLPEDQRAPVIDAYVEAITKSFVPIYIAVAVAFVASLFIRNHNLKAKGVSGAAVAA